MSVLLKMNLCEVVQVVFLVVGCGGLSAGSSVSMQTNCQSTEVSSAYGRKWVLVGQSKTENPHKCHWNFSMGTDHILLVNSTSILIPDRFELTQCLKFQQRITPKKTFRDIPIDSLKPHLVWCFNGEVDITYNNAVCPPPDVTHSLHMEVRVAGKQHLVCDSDEHGWMYHCNSNNVAQKLQVKKSCIPHIVEPKSGKLTDNKKSVTDEPDVRVKESVSGENKVATGGSSNIVTLVTVVLAISSIFIAVGAVFYIKTRARRNPRNAPPIYRVVMDNSLPHLRTGPHDYETVTSYLAPAPGRRAESDPRLRGIPDNNRSLEPSTDGTIDSFSYSEESCDLPDTLLQDSVMIPTQAAAGPSRSSSTAIKTIATENQDLHSMGTISSTQVSW